LSGVIQGETAEFIEKTEIEEQVPMEEPTKDSSQQPKSMETEPSATTPTSSSSAGYLFIIQQTLRKKMRISLSLTDEYTHIETHHHQLQRRHHQHRHHQQYHQQQQQIRRLRKVQMLK
jgi:hypothetical protein